MKVIKNISSVALFFFASSFFVCFAYQNQILSSLSIDYATVSGDDYKKAKQRIASLETQFSICFPNQKKMAQAVVFPELIRYHLLRDLFETESLKLIYVEEGSQIIDFSIGLFQMKPSFVENIENYLQKYPCLTESTNNFSKINDFKTSEIKKIRTQRIERLQQTDWQILYLSAFMSICYHRFVLS